MPAWAHLHEAVGHEVAGQFQAMGHDGSPAHSATEALADAFGLD